MRMLLLRQMRIHGYTSSNAIVLSVVVGHLYVDTKKKHAMVGDQICGHHRDGNLNLPGLLRCACNFCLASIIVRSIASMTLTSRGFQFALNARLYFSSILLLSW